MQKISVILNGDFASTKNRQRKHFLCRFLILEITHARQISKNLSGLIIVCRVAAPAFSEHDRQSHTCKAIITVEANAITVDIISFFVIFSFRATLMSSDTSITPPVTAGY